MYVKLTTVNIIYVSFIKVLVSTNPLTFQLSPFPQDAHRYISYYCKYWINGLFNTLYIPLYSIQFNSYYNIYKHHITTTSIWRGCRQGLGALLLCRRKTGNTGAVRAGEVDRECGIDAGSTNGIERVRKINSLYTCCGPVEGEGVWCEPPSLCPRNHSRYAEY